MVCRKAGIQIWVQFLRVCTCKIWGRKIWGNFGHFGLRSQIFPERIGISTSEYPVWCDHFLAREKIEPAAPPIGAEIWSSEKKIDLGELESTCRTVL